ncbi:MAG: hypothetical protein IPH35_27055 [Rhodoferax sp.]|nr:hypothetical protein [Rhodoferax sp.]
MVAITSVSDIAGQVSEKALNADKLTVASICLPSGSVKRIRSLIPAGLPKWRNSDDHRVAAVTDLLLKEAWSIAAGSLDKRDTRWSEFWRDSREVHARTAPLAGGPIAFLKAGTLKMLMLSQASALAMAHSVKVGTLPRIIDRKGRLNISECVIFDDEIQGDENRDALVEAWQSMNDHQPKMNSLGIFHEATAPLLTSEESEPLLLLADYAAGIVHALNSDANTIARSAVSREAVTRAHGRLRTSPKFHEFEAHFPDSYFEIFPGFERYSRAKSRPDDA